MSDREVWFNIRGEDAPTVAFIDHQNLPRLNTVFSLRVDDDIIDEFEVVHISDQGNRVIIGLEAI